MHVNAFIHGDKRSTDGNIPQLWSKGKAIYLSIYRPSFNYINQNSQNSRHTILM